MLCFSPTMLSHSCAGLSRLVSLRWLCLKWLDRLPVAHLAPLTNLEALQLKNIDKPPGGNGFLFAVCAASTPALAFQVRVRVGGGSHYFFFDVLEAKLPCNVPSS